MKINIRLICERFLIAIGIETNPAAGQDSWQLQSDPGERCLHAFPGAGLPVFLSGNRVLPQRPVGITREFN
jgi:hypothetical protein